jgi:uncharacterized protein YcbK (DUF882 family)
LRAAGFDAARLHRSVECPGVLVPGRTATKLTRIAPATPRAGFRLGIAAAALLFGCQSLQNAVADGDTRTISMHHLHTGEDITVTFKRNGRYDDAALKKLSWFLRDWRENKSVEMDPRLIDLVWEANREVEGAQPIQIICGYRDEHTNSMLRRRSSGVAQHSLHMRGMAMDFMIPGVPLDRLRAAGLRLQRGGVGYYPTSGSPFVHMDVGGVRHWPRMTRQQLVRVFPNGRTVHIPTDGKPLAGYALALADIERRGGNPSGMSLAAAANAGIDTEAAASAGASAPSLLAALFGSDGQPATEAAKPAAMPAPARPAAAMTVVATIPVPLPKIRPAAAPMVVAMAAPPPERPAAKLPMTVTPASRPPVLAFASVTANDIVRQRGYFVGRPGMNPRSAAAAELAQIGHRAGDPIATGSIRPAWLPSAEGLGNRALAYAAPPAAAADPGPRRTVVIRAAATATSIAIKAGGSVHPATLRLTDPWLNAMAITPSVWTHLSATQYGERDFRSLRAFLDKPELAVAMAFARDTHDRLDAKRFSGSAVVFVDTLTFAASGQGRTKTASLP